MLQADVWARGTMAAPPPPGGSLSSIQLHKTERSYKVSSVELLKSCDFAYAYDLHELCAG